MQRKWKRRWQRLTKVLMPPLTAGILLISAYNPAYANPTGGQVTGGSAVITANGAKTTINQTSNKAAINWQSFNIAQGETVNFVQPSARSIALNRVLGNNASSIYGTLSANGKVFLINPSGVLFAPGSQVNVGGLVASTLNITDSDFMNGNYTFSGSGTGPVVNQGTIKAADQAVLIGQQVRNEGTIAAQVTGLAAGNQVSLDFSGDKLLNLTVDTGAADGSAVNSGTILSDGGLVVMSAGTKSALLTTVVNNSGMIRAQSVNSENGVIKLEGSTVTNSGTLDASGKAVGQTGGTVKVLGDTVTLAQGSSIDVAGDAGGGKVLIGGAYQGGTGEYAATKTTVDVGAVISADAITGGNGGQVVVWANDTTNFAGTISARSGSASGNGGSVETSGHNKLQVKDTASVKTTAANGSTGTWLLDPANFTVADSGGDMTTSALKTALALNNVTITTTSGNASVQNATASNPNGTNSIMTLGDIIVNGGIEWTSDKTLTLSASNNIYLNSAITASNGGLKLAAGTATSGSNTDGIITPAAGSSISVGTFILNSGTWQEVSNSLSAFYAKDFAISNGTFLRAFGGNGTGGSPYQIADVYGLQGIGSNGMMGKSYTLANNLDAGGTKYWNYDSTTHKYKGFQPIGGNSISNYTGTFDGGGHTISNLFINSNLQDVGLFGTSDGTIRNVGLLNARVTVSNAVYSKIGALVGLNRNGTILNSFSAGGKVSGSDTYAKIGGLVGQNGGNGGNGIYGGGNGGSGGSGTITNSYSAAKVSGSGFEIGGLVGQNGGFSGGGSGGNGTVNFCYWDTDTSGISSAGIGSGTTSGATGLNTSQMRNLSSYTNWSIAATGGTSSVWRIYEGHTYPLLRSFLTPLTVTINDASVTYSGSAQSFGVSYSTTPNSALLGTMSYTNNATGVTGAAVNAGTYTVSGGSGLYSTQQGYDISYGGGGTLTINPAALTVKATAQSKTYGSNDPVLNYSVTGLQGSDTAAGVLNGSLTRTVGETVTGGPYAITQGTLLGNDNYTLSYIGNFLTINPAMLKVKANDVSRYYGYENPAFTYTVVSGLIGSDTKTDVVKNLALTTTAISTSPVAQYDITLGEKQISSNYTLNFIPGKLTVNQAPWQYNSYQGALSYVYRLAGQSGLTVGNHGTNGDYQTSTTGDVPGLTVVEPGINIGRLLASTGGLNETE